MHQEQVFIVLAADHGIAAVELPRKQRHALAAGGTALERPEFDRLEIAGSEKLGGDRRAAIGGIGAVIGDIARGLRKPHQSQVFDAVSLGRGHREYHGLGKRRMGPPPHHHVSVELFGGAGGNREIGVGRKSYRAVAEQ